MSPRFGEAFWVEEGCESVLAMRWLCSIPFLFVQHTEQLSIYMSNQSC